MVRYLKHGPIRSLDDVLSDLAMYDDFNAITPSELYQALGVHLSLSEIKNGIEYRMHCHEKAYSDMMAELQKNPNSEKSILLKNAHVKAGIHGIVIGETKTEVNKAENKDKIGLLEIFWMQSEPNYEILWLGNSNNKFYEMMLTQDFAGITQALYMLV